jgi:hypothetical protein
MRTRSSCAGRAPRDASVVGTPLTRASMQRFGFMDCWVKPGNDEVVGGRGARGVRRREFIALVGGAACLLVVACASPRIAAAAEPQKNAAADRVEKIYNGFAAGTDAAGNEGYNAAQKAAEQLRLDFLSSFQNPQTDASNRTAWDQEQGQLVSDSLKYAGDRTLDAAAMVWGETHLTLPVDSADDLIAEAETMPVSDQPGEREFDEYMTGYLAVRFDSLNKLATYYRTATADMEGHDIPLELSDLQAELRLDEAARTPGSKPKSF